MCSPMVFADETMTGSSMTWRLHPRRSDGSPILHHEHPRGGRGLVCDRYLNDSPPPGTHPVSALRHRNSAPQHGGQDHRPRRQSKPHPGPRKGERRLDVGGAPSGEAAGRVHAHRKDGGPAADVVVEPGPHDFAEHPGGQPRHGH